MTAANAYDPRTAFPPPVVLQLIHHRAPRADKRPQQRAVQPINPVGNQSDPHAPKYEHAHQARQESKGQIGQDRKDGLVRELGTIKIEQQNGKAQSQKCNTEQYEKEPAFDPQSGRQPAAQVPDVLEETFPVSFAQIVHEEECSRENGKSQLSPVWRGGAPGVVFASWLSVTASNRGGTCRRGTAT